MEQSEFKPTNTIESTAEATQTFFAGIAAWNDFEQSLQNPNRLVDVSEDLHEALRDYVLNPETQITLPDLPGLHDAANRMKESASNNDSPFKV